MTKSICSHEFDDVCKILDEISHETEQMTAKAFDGLLRHNRESLSEAEKVGARIEQAAKKLNQAVIAAREESKVLPSTTIIEVNSELKKIKYSLDKTVEQIRIKADDGLLFSDKALSELKDFFTAALEGLQNVHDLILTKNPVIISHIIERSDKYEAIGRKYAEEHQERLIRGICLPKSSLVYLVILDSLKDILRYLKAIALAFKEE
ncbi:MAG: hypothetical protein CVU89_08815 [Firmicutes bacterium HGW-Firmicutes-14]|nr:MAG: hypothetical protein CVU89_08815 [Firmicutes bacterium HGW-Firmicutes-14]